MVPQEAANYSDSIVDAAHREVMAMKDTIQVLFPLRNSPDFELRAVVRNLIRSDIRGASNRRRRESREAMKRALSPRVNTLPSRAA